MKELTDIVRAIPQVQTVVSFAVGFGLGVVTVLSIDEFGTPREGKPGYDYEPIYKPIYGFCGIGLGMIVAGMNRGTTSNYVVDGGAALFGNYFGFKFADWIIKALPPRR